LRLAAQSVGRTNTALGIFYRRKKAHLGPAKATTATARKLACLVYHLLKYKEQYREPDPATYQLKVQKTILAKIQKQAAAPFLPTSGRCRVRAAAEFAFAHLRGVARRDCYYYSQNRA
jgi:hypothetical protein